MAFKIDIQEIDRPICILGTGRCGSKLLFKLLASHPDVCWFSTINDKRPHLPGLAALLRIKDVGTRVQQKLGIYPRPMESYNIYNYLTDFAFTQQRPLYATDAAPEVMNRYRKYVKSILFYSGKKRFIQKHTGFARIQYLNAIFPNARFIHIVRDGRAVANSMAQVSWWDGTMKSWKWGPMKRSYEQEYIASNQEALILAAIVWKTLLDHLEEERRALPDVDFMEVRYDRLTADTPGVMRDILNFCQLPDSDVFQKRISAYPIRQERKPSFDSPLAQLMDACLGEHLVRYGFRD